MRPTILLSKSAPGPSSSSALQDDGKREKSKSLAAPFRSSTRTEDDDSGDEVEAPAPSSADEECVDLNDLSGARKITVFSRPAVHESSGAAASAAQAPSSLAAAGSSSASSSSADTQKKTINSSESQENGVVLLGRNPLSPRRETNNINSAAAAAAAAASADSATAAPARPNSERLDSIFGKLKKIEYTIQREKQIERLKQAQADARKQATASLTTLHFTVIKVHHVFKKLKRQKRILKLTAQNIENCKPGGLRPTRQFKYSAVREIKLVDSKTMVISFDGSHDFCYESQDVMTISNIISSRILKLQKASQLAMDYQVAIDYQRRLLEERHEATAVGSENASAAIDSSCLVTSTSAEEQVFWFEIEDMVSNAKSIEGRAVDKFLAEFSNLESAVPETAANCTRRFAAGTADYVLQKRGDQFNKMFRGVKATCQRVSLLFDMTPVQAIETAIQRVLIGKGGLEKRVLSCISKDQYASRLQDFNKNRMILRGKSQDDIGIPKDAQSPDNWTVAIRIFNEFDQVIAPREKILLLMRAVRAIYLLHLNRSLSQDQAITALAADHFLPIFIYILVNSNIKNPVIMAEYLTEFCDPEVDREPLYYLTTFASAQYYIECYDENAETGAD